MEKIGIQGIFDDRDFQAGLRRYLSDIDAAERATGRAASQVTSSTGAINRAWQGAGAAIQTALGFLIGNVVCHGLERLADLLQSQASAAFEAVASYECLGYVVESLVARELAQGEEQIIQQQVRISLTESAKDWKTCATLKLRWWPTLAQRRPGWKS